MKTTIQKTRNLLLCFLIVITTAINANVITDENAKTGTGNWKITTSSPGALAGRSYEIEGFCSKLSVKAGETLDVYVSTNTAAMYTAEIYRMGYYGGTGGRLMATYGPIQGIAQTVPTAPYENLVECNWPNGGFQITIGNDWVSGIYVGKLIRQGSNYASYVIFVVRDERQCDLIFKPSDFNWIAYNEWGGGSLYKSVNGVYDFNVEVSFDRPYGEVGVMWPMNAAEAAPGIGAGEFFALEWPMVYELEKHGYDISYISCIDAHYNVSSMTRTKGIVTAGHDEYWSQAQYNNTQTAVTNGVGLAVFSGNAIFCAVDIMPSRSKSTPDRTMERASMFSTEYNLMGAKTPTQYNDYGDFVCTNPTHWVYTGTGMKQGDKIKDLIGWEMHGSPYKTPTPTIWSTGTLRWGGSYGSTSFEAPLGNTVVSASSIWWASHMGPAPGHINHGSYQPYEGGSGTGAFPADPRVNQMTFNICDRMIATSPTSTPDTEAPSVPTGLATGTITPTTVVLNWNASTDNVVVAGYDVYQGATLIASPNTNTYTATGLTGNTAYSFQVRARDAVPNYSAKCAAINVTTTIPIIDNTPPTNPSNLAATSVTSTSLVLNWTASTDAIGVTGYDVYQGAVLIGSPVGNTFTVTGLTANTSYSFSVKAKDAAGNISQASNTVSVSTPITPSNIALIGTGYRWYGNISSTSDANKVAEPAVNDGNTTTNFWLKGGATNSDDIANAYEAAGVVWTTAQDNVTTVEFINGTFGGSSSDNGDFTADFKLQFSNDGTTWADATGWTLTPAYAYNNATVSGATFTFIGSVNNIRGARVTGQVRTNTSMYSWECAAREVKVSQSIGTINSTVQENKITVFPNPNNGSFTIETQYEGLMRIIIYNAGGQQISDIASYSSTQTIQIPNAIKGVYIIKIISCNETTNNKIIVE